MIKLVSRILAITAIASLGAAVAPLPAEAGNAPQGFLEICSSSEATPAQRRTVKMMFTSGLRMPYNPEHCAKAFARLKEQPQLILRFGDLTDLSPLGGLDALTLLHVEGNHLSSLDTLPALPNLASIIAMANEISSAANLARFPKLQMLDLRYNEITDLGQLSRPAQAVAFDLGSNPFTSLAGLNELGPLLSLGLAATKIRDFEALRDADIQRVDLSELADPSILNDLPDHLEQIKGLAISHNNLDSAQVAAITAKFPSLVALEISFNKVTELSFLSRYPTLIKLLAGENAIAAIPAGLLSPKMTEIELRNNPISDFGFMRQIQEVSGTLDISATGFTHFADIAHLVGGAANVYLDKTNLSGITATDVASASWDGLTWLDISATPIATLEGLKGLAIPKLSTIRGAEINLDKPESCPVEDVAEPIKAFCDNYRVISRESAKR